MEMQFKIGDIITHNKVKCLMRIMDIQKHGGLKVWLEDAYGEFTKDSILSYLLQEDVSGIRLVCRDSKEEERFSGDKKFVYEINFPKIKCIFTDTHRNISATGISACNTAEDRFDIALGKEIARLRAQKKFGREIIRIYQNQEKSIDETLDLITQ